MCVGVWVWSGPVRLHGISQMGVVGVCVCMHVSHGWEGIEKKLVS